MAATRKTGDPTSSPRRTAAAAPAPAPPKAKVMDLLGFDDNDSAPAPPANTTKHAAAPSLDGMSQTLITGINLILTS